MHTVLKSWKTTSRQRVLTSVLISCFCVALGTAGAQAAPIIDTYAGGGNGDGNFAIDASLDPRGFTLAGSFEAPDIYIADYSNNRIRRVSGATGLIETIAGSGEQGFSGDGGSAVNAKLNLPLDVAVDSSGNVYIADYQNNRVRKVTPSGLISTFAGNGTFTYGGDGGPATQAGLRSPWAVAIGPDGALYIADQSNNRIRRVGCTGSTCIITTVVGNGAWGFGGDGGPALNATLKEPTDVSFDGAGNMLITDRGNDRVRRVSNGIITTIAGGGIASGGFTGDGGAATNAVLFDPYQAVADSAGNVYIADNQHRRIRMVQASNGFIYTVAGNGAVIPDTSGDGGPATEAGLWYPYGIAATSSGNFWFSQYQQFAARSLNNRIRRVTKGTITSIIGGGLGHGGPAYDAQTQPRGADARPGQGVIPDLFYADGNHHAVRYVNGATGDIFTIAGTSAAGYSGDGGPAVLATLNSPTDVAVDNAGNVYVADTANNVVRRISDGYISTVAGNGRYGSSGDGGPATAASLAQPAGVAVDPDGRLYIADTANNRIRVVNANGTISTVAGTGVAAYGGDGGPATEARLRAPRDIAIANDGTLFIADSSNHRIRAVDRNGTISTYAGLGFSGFSGDDGPALSALLNSPGSIDVDANGRVYFTDVRNLRVRTIDTTLLHVISTIAGNGSNGYSGDGGPADQASFSEPDGVAVDPSSAFMFVNSDADGRVRIVALGGAAPPTPSFTATAIPPTPTRTPTFVQTPTRTATATRTNTSGLPQASVFGDIQYYSNGQNVAAATINMTGSSTTSVTTNSRGDYSASVPQGTWSLEPSKTGGFGNAVTSLDAARVLQLLSGLQTFTDDQRLACDASGNGSLSTLDAVYILQFSAGLIDRLPVAQMCGSDWLFVPDAAPAANQATIPPLLTSGNCQQGAIVLNPLVGSVDGQDFEGILLGDCTGNWTTASASLQRQSAATATVHAGNARKGAGGRYTVPLYVKSARPFQALDLRLQFDDAASFVAATARGDADEALISAQGADGTLTISLASGPPISGSKGSVILLEFRGADPAVTLDGALVDEQRARVVSH